MRDVEVKFNRFKLKKLLALSMCGVMAMGVMLMPVNAEEIKPTGASGSASYSGDVSYTGDATGDANRETWVATGDAKDPSKVIDIIKKAEGKNVTVEINEEVQTMPKSVFQAARESGKELTFISKDANGRRIQFKFSEGIKQDVDVNFAIKTTMDNDLVKNLKDEGALVFEFAHEGVLPGPMQVTFYNAAYKDQKNATAFLYLLNEKTGKLEIQEQAVTIKNGVVSFTIDHCSSYVTTLTKIAETKLQVAEPKADAPDAIKQTGTSSNVFQTISLLAICGAAVVIASKKEENA